MRPVLALNCLLQIEQERSEEESSVGDALNKETFKTISTVLCVETFLLLTPVLLKPDIPCLCKQCK